MTALLSILLALGCTPIAWAEGASGGGGQGEVYNIVIKKQDEKAKSRWSLSDWLDTRDKMRMQDVWLALHSPSPFEFFFGGTYRNVLSPTSAFSFNSKG